MKLYSSAISPYAARVRIQVLHKQLPVQIVPPPGGMGSAEVKAKNPAGKIPVLDMGEQSLAESWAIMSYLEALHPEPAMLPADAYAAAKLQELVRFTDLYLAPAMFPLFLALRGKADDAAVAQALQNLDAQLQVLEQQLTHRQSLNSGLALDLLDAALLPIIWYARVLACHFGVADCLAALPVTQQWWQQASKIDAASAVLAQMQTGLQAAMPALFAEQE